MSNSNSTDKWYINDNKEIIMDDRTIHISDATDRQLKIIDLYKNKKSNSSLSPSQNQLLQNIFDSDEPYENIFEYIQAYFIVKIHEFENEENEENIKALLDLLLTDNIHQISAIK